VVVRASGKKFFGQRNVLVGEIEVYCANEEKKYCGVLCFRLILLFMRV